MIPSPTAPKAATCADVLTHAGVLGQGGQVCLPATANWRDNANRRPDLKFRGQGDQGRLPRCGHTIWRSPHATQIVSKPPPAC
jgi:hypothetical protein